MTATFGRLGLGALVQEVLEHETRARETRSRPIIRLNGVRIDEGVKDPPATRKNMPPAVAQKGSVAVLGLAAAMLLTPRDIHAESSAWQHLFATVIHISDWMCIGIIVFAGSTWMFGNRSKGLEFLIGGSIGYVIIRHAEDIQKFLANL